MQRQKSTVDSFPDAFDHGSSTSNSGVNQQLLWNDMRNPVENRLPVYSQSSGDANNTYAHTVSCDGKNLSGWNLGESSSHENRRTQVTHDEAKMEHWSSSFSTNAGAGLRLDERRSGRTSLLSLGSVNVNLTSNQVANGPLFLQNSSSDDIPQNINISVGSGNIGSGDHVMESHMYPHPCQPGESETEHIPSAGGSADPIGTAGSAEYFTNENDGRPGCSLDGRRLSCKRKAPEEVSEQLSLGGSSSCFHRAENSVWPAAPACYNAASSSSISTPTDNPLAVNSPQLNLQFGVVRGVTPDNSPDLNVAGYAESSQRNLRMRMNPAHQQDSASSNLSSTENVARPSHVPPHESSPRLLSFDHLLDLRPAAANTTPSLSQSHIMHIPSSQRNVNPFSWNGAFNSRVGSSTSSVIPGARTVSLEEVHARSMPRNFSEHPMLLPATAMRNLIQDPTHWTLANGNTRVYGNVASPQVGSTSVVLRSAAPTWVPQHNPPIQYPRRLSEVARRSLFSEPGGSSSNFAPLRLAPAISQEMVFSSPAAQHVHHQPYGRSTLSVDRQGADVLGVPLSFRNVPSASEARSRLLSEIRNVLEFIRRGAEGLRFEDVFILDQSILLGVRELHDRHRGMRLDVDNMTYEELLALEERIGDVSTGLNENAILNCLKRRKYCSIGLGAPSEVEPCCICQEEYVDGEDIGALDCGHDFHTGCIKQWLMQKNLCPICKMAAFVT